MSRLKDFLKKRPGVWQMRKLIDDVSRISKTGQFATRIQQETFVSQLLAEPRYQDPKRLARYGAQVYSQHDEDGMIEEIFRRIGVTSRVFAECAVGDGLENNSTYLLMKGWSGFWFEFKDAAYQAIQRRFWRPIDEGRLRVAKEFMTMESAADAFRRAGVPVEFDLLSLDIDRNTSFLWRGLAEFRPRVAVVEYNASIPASEEWEIEYDARAVWNGSLYFGASLKALERLGRELGYALVGCEITGTNAFFVRQDLVGDAFSAPYTAENHYEPPRYFLTRTVGHRRGFG
jgi:hypothetical protein